MPDLYWVMSSSLLITAIIVIRAAFGHRLTPALRYALWGVVVVRLLVPGTLFAVDLDWTAAPEAQREEAVVPATATVNDSEPTVYMPLDSDYVYPSVSSPQTVNDSVAAPPTSAAVQSATDTAAAPALADATPVSQERIIRLLWLAGMAVTFGVFTVSNLRLRQRLHTRRRRLDVDCRLPVYVVPGLSSSCLFAGAVYITPDAADDPYLMCHVLEHEQAHARHGDRLWSLLRCAALVLHWYNPLVWWAALLSRQDSELWADAGAIARLGDEARESYGATLIRLASGSPLRTPLLVTATAMHHGKRELRERIAMIARRPRRSVAVTVAVLLLAVAAAGCSFSGPAEEADQAGDTAVTSDGSAVSDTYLTGDELAYFNNVFFGPLTCLGPSSYINIHNQFLSSLYAAPEDIDLYELFYCGAGYPDTELSPEELELVGMPEVCSTDRMSASELDAVFFDNTGLHLADTKQTGLDHFEYLPQYDAYYHSHGDTNYRNSVTIVGGAREDDLVHLYYYDDFMGGGWKCVTLRDAGEGSWHFVSNLEAEKPALPTVYPAGEPWLTVSLKDLKPCAPQEVEMTAHEDDCAEWTGGVMTDNGVTVRIYTSTDGDTYAAVIDEMAFSETGELSRWQARSFLTIPKEAREANVSFFRDLFGYDGLIVSYEGEMPPIDGRINGISRLYYYYTFSDVGTPTLLASCVSDEEPLICDLDGDGENELLATASERADLFFRRDGKMYAVDVYERFISSWDADKVRWFNSAADESRRCLRVIGYAAQDLSFDDHLVHFWRYIYFDGDDLLIYKDPDITVSDNVADTVEAPAQVIADAKAALAAGYSQEVLDDWADDWCLSLCELTDRVVRRDYELEIYRIEKLFHAPDPSQVMLAGGAYVREDDWVRIDHSQYLVYQVKDGQRRLLEGGIAFDIAGEARTGELAYIEVNNGLRTPSELTGPELLWLFRTRGPWVALDMLGPCGEEVYGPALERLCEYAAIMGSPDELQELFLNWSYSQSGLSDTGRDAYDYLTSIMRSLP